MDKKAQQIVSDYLVEQHSKSCTVFVHPNDYAYIRALGKDFYDEATEREIATTGVVGHIGKFTIKVDNSVPECGNRGINRLIKAGLKEQAIRLGEKDRPATEEEIKDMMKALEAVALDPNLTIVT